jgi:hypothetical protein
MGEPLGDSATYRKADGGLVLGGGGGGGGGSPPAATTQTTTQELPEWARGYAKDVLAKGAALTDIEKNPYQVYKGERIAGFGDLQNQSFQGARALGPNALSVQGGVNALNAGRNYQNMATDPNAVNAYMSPYVSNVLNNQIAASNRGYDISAQNARADATKAGAYGGSRGAIMQAENERARNAANQGIVASGLQNAFQNAQQAQQFGSTLGMQGTQAAIGAGQNIFGQQQGTISTQNQLGAQQQQQQQRGLDLQQQDYLNQQNYPYKQLGFMSDLIRGTPIGMQSSNQVYQAGPTTAQNIASLGLGAAGIASLAKAAAGGGLMDSYADGGSVQGYADGGEVSPMHDEQAMAGDVSKLSDQQLQQIIKHPTTKAEFEAAQQEMALRASMRNGLASAVTPQMADRMAGGGIVAFAGGGFNDQYKKSLSDLLNEDVSTSPEERMSGVQAALPQLQSMYGESATAKYQKDLDATYEKLKGQDNLGDANAFFAAAEAITAGPNMGRQIGAALGAYGRAKGQANKEMREAQNQLRQSQIALASAEQARKDGLTGKAFELQKISEDQKAKGLDRKISATEKMAELQNREDATRMQVGATMAAANRPGELERTIAEYEQRLGRKLDANEYKKALGEFSEAKSPYKYLGPNKDVERNVAVETALNKQIDVMRLQNEASNPKTSPERKAEIEEILDAKRKALRGAAPQQPQQTGGLQDGQRAMSKSGKPIVYRNGQWEYE